MHCLFLTSFWKSVLCSALLSVGVVGTLAKLAKAITLRITTNKLYFILSERLVNGGVGIWCEMLQVIYFTVLLFSATPDAWVVDVRFSMFVD